MIAPKGPGHTVRSTYLNGGGVPSLIAIYQDGIIQIIIAQKILLFHMLKLMEEQEQVFLKPHLKKKLKLIFWRTSCFMWWYDCIN